MKERKERKKEESRGVSYTTREIQMKTLKMQQKFKTQLVCLVS
jgi:hypothetical protein